MMKKYLFAFLLFAADSYALEQACHSVIMVRPIAFGYNVDTAVNNPYQNGGLPLSDTEVQEYALREFDLFVERLEAVGIEVQVVQDTLEPHTPDSIFPNNWISLHHDGTVITYPMFGKNRRQERKLPVLDQLKGKVEQVVALEHFEKENRFLEGTGSIIFDHINRTAFANRSDRTDPVLFEQVCDFLGYQGVLFDALDQNGREIYHTNIMLFIGTDVAVVCAEAITNDQDRKQVLDMLGSNGREVIEITHQQMNGFCGNLLEVMNREGERVIVMSEHAATTFTDQQLALLEDKAEVVSAPIDLIETVGGGSARCMLLGNHLPNIHNGQK